MQGRHVATNRPGKPGLTSFFPLPISFILENEATEQIKWSPGVQVFLLSPLFHLILEN